MAAVRGPDTDELPLGRTEAPQLESFPTISQVSSEAQVRQVRDLLREYTTWALTVDPDTDAAPTFQGLEAELASLPGIYAPPKGRLLLAVLDGQPAGCVALKPHDQTTGELKRMYVRPAFRGRHVGSRLVAALLEEARDCGYRRVVLDTHISMTRAHAIYAAAGFRVVEAPADFPDSLKPVVVFMELDLE